MKTTIYAMGRLFLDSVARAMGSLNERSERAPIIKSYNNLIHARQGYLPLPPIEKDSPGDRASHNAEKQPQKSVIATSISILALIVSCFAAYISFSQMEITKGFYQDTREQARIQTSAYISINAVRISKFAPNSFPEIYVSLKNVGVTPASELKVYLSTGIADVDKRMFGFMAEPPANKMRFLPPGAETYITSVDNQKVTEEEYADFESGKKTIKSIIQVVYNDAYGREKGFQVCVMKTIFQKADPDSAAFCE